MSTLRTISLLFLLVPDIALAVEQYSYRVTDQIPLSREHFVQGLEIVDEYLYVSTGRFGKSHLLRYHFREGGLDAVQKLHPKIFAEGLTVFGDRIYQLTWRNRMLLIYRRSDLKPIEWHPIPGEGWGLTHDSKQLIYSDGSDKLHFYSPLERKITRSLPVRENGRPVKDLNELEWVDGKVWANVWRSDRIVIIHPESGEVTASIDLTGLLPVTERNGREDVLNGIARNPADGGIWVTGKLWPWIYRIELVPAASSKDAQSAPVSR